MEDEKLKKKLKMNSYITRGQIISLLIALMVITILMMIVFNSIKTRLIGMILNIAPVIFAGGLMGYLGTPLDFVTMVIGPMALGLAVDDTIHFINHCKLEFFKTGNYPKAIRETFKTIGKALFMTFFILVLGFAAYITSISKMFLHLGNLCNCGNSCSLAGRFLGNPSFDFMGEAIWKGK